MNLIAVDDDRVSLLRLRTIVEELGHDCRAFDSATEAWESHQDSPAEVIVSDWQMPSISGVEFCQLVRKQRDTPYTYFILNTAEFTGDEDYTRAIAADVDDFLVKPLRRDDLWRRLHVAKRILKFSNHIQQLEALLPICMYCKRVRDGESGGEVEHWEKLEEFISARTGSEFSHGICPDCLDQVSVQMGLRGAP